MKRLDGKTALITGCNRGIGRAILECFVQEGASIIACSRQVTKELENYYKDIQGKYHVEIFPITLDLADEESVNNAVMKVFALKKPLHILVNNAGTLCLDGLMRLTFDKLDEVFRVNYFSPLMLIKGLVMPLMKAKGASVINMASVAGIDGTEGNCSYGASKASMILASKTLAKELAKAKIRVNAIAPNIVKTDILNEIIQESVDEQINKSALQRAATPEEIAKVALFLASDESLYITGQTIRVDGGL